MGDDRTFLREAINVLGFFLQVRPRDEQREVGVDVTRGLEHPVELVLHVLPKGVTKRLDYHASSNV